MKILSLLVIFILIRSLGESQEKPEYFKQEEWELIESKLLPEEMSVKSQLDKIFSKSNVNLDGKGLLGAGFRVRPIWSPSKVVVASHPKLKGYLIKTFADVQPIQMEWRHWLKRIQGAEVIADWIEATGSQKLFTVPKKWIYMIPNPNGSGKSTILIVEKLDIRSWEKNRKIWKKKTKKSTLDQLYVILESLGLYDSTFLDNIPFTKDGRIAFVDTEHFYEWPVLYYRLNSHLSEKNKEYWINLTGQ